LGSELLLVFDGELFPGQGKNIVPLSLNTSFQSRERDVKSRQAKPPLPAVELGRARDTI